MTGPNHIQPPGGRFVAREEALSILAARLTMAPVDTRAALAGFVPAADSAQLAVITARDHTIRVVAPAGSGKTQTVINRAVARIREGVKPDRILLLTFDNSAATALKEKLREQATTLPLPVGTASGIERLQISTLNAFGYRVLRELFPTEHRPLIQPPRPHRIVRGALNELRIGYRDYHAALPVHLAVGFYLELFSLLKNNLFDPQAFDDQVAGDFLLSLSQAAPLFPNPDQSELVEHAIGAVLWLLRKYDADLRSDGTLDFDDQKLRAYLALQANPSVLRTLQARFDEVVVDEFQDINLLDFVLVKEIAAQADLVVTGDDDQAIYGFRGCSPDYIIDLEKRLGRPVTSFELRVNYRCPPNLVAHADRLIRRNTHRIVKDPVPYRSDPSEIKVVSTISATLEAKSITTFMRRVLEGNPTLGFRDVAVLYRTHAQSLPLQLEFILNDVPYFVRVEDNILANEVLERLLGVLRLKLALEAGQSPSVEDQVLAVRGYFTFLQPWQAERLRQVFGQGGEFFEIVGGPSFAAALPKAANSRFSDSVRELVTARTLLQALDLLRAKWKGMRGMVGSLEDVVAQKASLAEIYEVATEFGGNTFEFVTTLDRALSRARATSAGRDEAGVALLTYFRAKGRQWHTVVLTTCNEGLIPHSRASLEDERRLFYVALTRASSNLLISYLKDSCGSKVAPSRFLSEAGLFDEQSAVPGPVITTRQSAWYATTTRPTIAPRTETSAELTGKTQPAPASTMKRWYERDAQGNDS